MTGTGLVYGSLWDDSERGGCQDFIRPLKRAQQMPWHVRSTDAWPTTATLLSLVLSLGCVPLCGSRPSHRFKFAFPARVRRASREVVSDIAPRSGHFVARRVYSRRKNAAFSSPPLLRGRYTVGRARLLSKRTDLESKKSWNKKSERSLRGNLVLGGEVPLKIEFVICVFWNRTGDRAIRLTIDKEGREKREKRTQRG